MSTPYIPNKDSLFRNWLNNFAALIVAAPATYGLTAGDATTINAEAVAFDAAYTTATDPSTRTKPTVAAKDAARAHALLVCRPYAQNVRNNAGVSNENKLALGLTVPDRTPTPIPPPATNPILNVIAATPGQHTVRYSDQLTPDRRAKPAGAISIQLYRAIADNPEVDPAVATFYGNFTSNPVPSTFTEDDNGRICTYFARWQNRRGQVGPWSPSASFTIAF